MENVIVIKSKIGTVDEISFNKILNELDSIGGMFKWSILNFEAMGDLGGNKSIIDFEDEINNSVQGKYFSWEELKDLSIRIRQVLFMTLIAVKDISLIKRENIESKSYSNTEIVIDVIDGYLWSIFIRDQVFLKSYKEKLSDLSYE